MSDCINSKRKAAYDTSACARERFRDKFGRLYSVGCGFSRAHNAERYLGVEEGSAPGAVENKRRIRDLRQKQRIIRIGFANEPYAFSNKRLHFAIRVKRRPLPRYCGYCFLIESGALEIAFIRAPRVFKRLEVRRKSPERFSSN